MIRLLAICLLVSLVGCATGGQKTILLSIDKAEEHQMPWYRWVAKNAHLNAKNKKSLVVGAHEFPVWMEIGRIAKRIDQDTEHKYIGGQRATKNIWGMKIIVPFYDWRI